MRDIYDFPAKYHVSIPVSSVGKIQSEISRSTHAAKPNLVTVRDNTSCFGLVALLPGKFQTKLHRSAQPVRATLSSPKGSTPRATGRQEHVTLSPSLVHVLSTASARDDRDADRVKSRIASHRLAAPFSLFALRLVMPSARSCRSDA